MVTLPVLEKTCSVTQANVKSCFWI